MLILPSYCNGVDPPIFETKLERAYKPHEPLVSRARFGPNDPSPAPISRWGSECGRGWVRDERFGSGQVIKGTNRNKTRKVYRAQAVGSSGGENADAS